MKRIEQNENHSKVQKFVEKSHSYKEDDESIAKSVTGSQNTQPAAKKLLGVQWYTEENCFVFYCKQFLDDKPKENPTKRDVARMTSRIYDPVGSDLKSFVKVYVRDRLNGTNLKVKILRTLGKFYNEN